MQYNQLGKTDIKVSHICLGTMTWGKQNSKDEAEQQLNYAVNQGINFIDLAEMYPVPPSQETYGLTEQIFGNWLKKYKKRDKLIIATKVAGPSPAGPRDLSYIRKGPRLNKQHIKKAIDESLRRLQTDYIDLYQIHWPERKVNNFGQLDYKHELNKELNPIPIFETLQALDEETKKGRIRFIGVSNESPWGIMQFLQIAKKHKFPRIVSIQNCYNLLHRIYEIGLSEISINEQCGLLAYSPLSFGVLSGKYLNNQKPKGARMTLYPQLGRYLNKEGIQATKQYKAIAEKYNLEFSQMSIAFTLANSFTTSSIIGATNLNQLKSNIESGKLKLPIELIQDIEKIHLSNSNPCP